MKKQRLVKNPTESRKRGAKSYLPDRPVSAPVGGVRDENSPESFLTAVNKFIARDTKTVPKY